MHDEIESVWLTDDWNPNHFVDQASAAMQSLELKPRQRRKARAEYQRFVSSVRSTGEMRAFARDALIRESGDSWSIQALDTIAQRLADLADRLETVRI